MFSRFRGVAEYIDTAVDYNNDYLFNNDYNRLNYKIISKMSYCHYSDYDFFVSNHLKCLGRNFIDIMLIHNNRGDWIELAKRMNKDIRFLEVGVSNFTKEDILKYKEVIGKFPAYNEIEINPYYIDKETIDFCKENNIKIISYAILGGKYNSWRNVSDFGLPYLVSYAAKYADIVICRANSLKEVDSFVDVIKYYDMSDNLEAVEVDKKAIEPMNYRMPLSTNKTFSGKPTYSILCGKNLGDLKEEVLDIKLPDFEMLGDYKVYLRYLYRQDYKTIKEVYDYDFLIGDDGNYYVVYLFDEDNRLTKVNHNSKIEVRRYERN
jgi:hypothetical protein